MILVERLKTIKWRGPLTWLAVVVGIVQGPLLAESWQTISPPLQWNDNLFLLTVAPFQVLVVLGFQAYLRDWRSVRFFCSFFEIGSVNMIASGASGLVYGAIYKVINPGTSMPIAGGIGLLIGVRLVRFLFRKPLAALH